MVQLSTNSNKQIEWLVAAQPTPIGKHRAAFLQAMEKQKALSSCHFELKKLKARVAIKKAEIQVQLESAVRAEDAGDITSAAYLKAQANLLAIELEEMQDGLEWIALQQQDAERELKVSQALMAEACKEGGLDFNSIDEETYQRLMGENVLLLTDRRLSAELMAAVVGVPAGFAETLAGLPSDDRKRMLSQYGYLCGLMESAQVNLANPMMDREQQKELEQELNALRGVS